MHRAYAKINLGLLIHGRRPDGYHEIETIFHRIDLYDELRFEESSDVEISCSDPAIPSDEKNLCYKAATLLREHLHIQDGVRIILKKNIPVGAGLGGGSADAALVLRKLPVFWKVGISEADLASLALQLGSDVPYFLRTGTALARGRGEILEYFHLSLPYTNLVCFPNIPISTQWAYSRIDDVRSQPATRQPRPGLPKVNDPQTICKRLTNDFEEIVFEAHPDIRKVKESMEDGGAECASLSGSGSSVFGLFSSAEHAKKTGQLLESNGYRIFLTPSNFVPVHSEPA